MKKRITNANFARTERFKLACELAGVAPTKRQASKFRRRLGRAAKINQQALNQHIINLRFRKEEGE